MCEDVHVWWCYDVEGTIHGCAKCEHVRIKPQPPPSSIPSFGGRGLLIVREHLSQLVFQGLKEDSCNCHFTDWGGEGEEEGKEEEGEGGGRGGGGRGGGGRGGGGRGGGGRGGGGRGGGGRGGGRGEGGREEEEEGEGGGRGGGGEEEEEGEEEKGRKGGGVT